MSSLAPITFPPPLPPPSYEVDEHGENNIVNAPLEPQPLPTPSTRWYFDKEELMNTPSRRAGIDADKELTYRQQSANYIQDMGQRLQVNQLCINTAIVYMHRFFMYHSFQQFQKNAISTASIFLAAKVEEQPRKLEYVIKIAHYCLYRDTQPAIDVKSDTYLAQSTELVSNENILLQTLGFDVSVDHPHTHVVKCCQLVRASKDLAQTSYFMATNSLHLTTMCLQYPPSVVACVCIHLACKWSNWEIPRSKEGKEWYYYVDGSVTPQQLESLTSEFLTIFNKSPSRLKKRILNLSNATSGGSGGSGGGAITNFPTHFTVDRNSSGAQTIKSRSRTPSPTQGSKVKPPPPHPTLKHKPTPTAAPTAQGHFPSKQAPPPPGYKHPPQPPNKGPYPHAPVPGPRPTYRELPNVAGRQPPPLKQAYPPPVATHPPSNGIHSRNHPPPPPQQQQQQPASAQSRPYPPPANAPMQQAVQHTHSSVSQKVPGSQGLAPPHLHPTNRQSLLKSQQHHVPPLPQQVKTHAPQPPTQGKDPLQKHVSFPHHPPNNGNHGGGGGSNHSLNLRPHPPGSTAVKEEFFPPPATTHRGSFGYLDEGKKRPLEHNSMPDDPNPKRARQDEDSTLSGSMSLTNTFPLLSSEIGLGPPLVATVPRGSTDECIDNTSPTTSSSSGKKKKKKKEHKHKKEEKRHKEEKKNKKDKHHRDKHGESDGSHRSKKKKSKSGAELGISQVQDNSLKIKIVTSKDSLDAKSGGRGGSGRSLQSNTVVYY